MFLEESVCVSLIDILIVQIGKIYKLFLDIIVKLSFNNKAVTNLINPIIILLYLLEKPFCYFVRAKDGFLY